MITDTLSNASLYPLGPAWKQAAEFLATLTPSTPDGEYPLLGDRMFARVMTYKTKPPADAILEAHRRYVDVQIVLSGTEVIEWFPRNGLEIAVPYCAKSEAEFYARKAPGPVAITLTPGHFVVLWPDDAHMPSLQAGDSPETVRKVVVKIETTLLHTTPAT